MGYEEDGWDDGGKTALVPVLVGFVVVFMWCLVEILRNYQMMTDEPDLANSSAGWAMRKWFHLMVGIANFGRATGIVIQLSVKSKAMDVLDCDDFSCWVLGFAHVLPDLLFMTAFSLLTLFWAQLYYATWGISYASLRPGFVLGNGLIYLVFAIIAIVTAANQKDYGQLRVDSFYLLAVGNIVATVAMLYYGLKVVSQLRPKSTVSQVFPARGMILKRVGVLCLLCSIVLILRTVYSIYSLLDDNGGYPHFTERYGFDALQYTVLDFVPSVVILLLTMKRRSSPYGSNSMSSARVGPGSGDNMGPGGNGTMGRIGSGSSSTWAHRNMMFSGASMSNREELFCETGNDAYGPMQLTPKLLDESLTARLLRSDREMEETS